MTNSSRELIVLGLNLRTYDAARKTWHLKWRNALAGTWTDLGPEEFGGVTFDGWSIIHSFKESVASHAIRASLTSTLPQPISRGAEEKSDGANVWSEFMIIEAQRTNEWETATNR